MARNKGVESELLSKNSGVPKNEKKKARASNKKTVSRAKTNSSKDPSAKKKKPTKKNKRIEQDELVETDEVVEDKLDTEPESELKTETTPKKKSKTTQKKSKGDKSTKSTKKPKTEPEPRKESKEWKKHLKQYKSVRRRTRILGIMIILLLIIASVLGYIYFFELDTDGDGIPDATDNDDDNDIMTDVWEEKYGLDPKNDDDAFGDKDGDGLRNADEFKFQSNPIDKDTDDDGLLDSEEFNLKNTYGKSSDPNHKDSDRDGMDDYWEWQHDLNPVQYNARSDSDSDGFDANRNGKLESHEFYSNIDEYNNLTDPKNKDTDGDGMWDGWEMFYRKISFNLDPTDPEDGTGDIDFIIDQEGNIFESPDGLTNLQEFLNRTDPTNPDTDGDTLTDYDEIVLYGTDPLEWDSDNDGLWDGWEVAYGGSAMGLDPNSGDSDGDSVSDRFEDLDGDGLDNNRENQHGTSPVSIDSDSDGMHDGWEVFSGCLEPIFVDNNTDKDSDLLSNLAEFENGTDPCDPDTDNDGLTDGLELLIGFHGQLIDGIYRNTSNLPRYYSNATNNDSDNDGLLDGQEVHSGWNASTPDTDGDGVLDPEEVTTGNDGFITDPTKADTDNDRLTDYEEINSVFGFATKPTKADDDEDGLLDGDELLTDFYPFTKKIDHTDPTNKDSDGDGMEDGFEGLLGKTGNLTVIRNFDIRYGTDYFSQLKNNTDVKEIWLVNPLNASDRNQDADYDGYDTSGEGIIIEEEEFTNFQEFNWTTGSTSPINWDSDGDGMSDGWESQYFKDEFNSPDPTIADGNLDVDGDGISYYINGIKYHDKFTNLEEYQTGKDLNNDGIIDFDTTDPNLRNTDRVGLDDYKEIWTKDSDGDGLYDGWELIFNGTTKNPEGYIPYDPGLGKGKFNPNLKNSDNMGADDGEEDYDNDKYQNIAEQGNPFNPNGGSSDPTDETDRTRSRSSRSGKAIDRNNDHANRLCELNKINDHNHYQNQKCNIYTQSINRKYLIINQYLIKIPCYQIIDSISNSYQISKNRSG
jgi:hypothetical protein